MGDRRVGEVRGEIVEGLGQGHLKGFVSGNWKKGEAEKVG